MSRSSMKNKQTLSCLTCGLHEEAESPKMQPYGDGERGILIIGEAPGQVEDRKGLPWQGKTGRLLQSTMHKFGIDLFKDCVCVNAVNCRPPRNRTPKPFEIDCCREVIVANIIDEFKPKVIILLGSIALQSFLSPRWPTDLGGITKWRGFKIPDRDYRCFVVPTFHPSYVVRMDSREVNTVWEQDLKLAVEARGEKFPRFPKPDIRIIDDLDVLTNFEPDEIAFDYETTGLKPQRKGHRVVCASVAINDSLVYAFMIPPSPAEREPFVQLLCNPGIGKMAHNMKFEKAWSEERLRVEVVNWQWDSMLAAHQLDNRSGITGLKFQTYVNFGVADYSSEVTPYLRKKEDGGNGFNSIYELLEEEGGKEKLLTYCALDSHYEYLLAKKQMELLDYQYLPF
jgi:DNA polymerase